MWEVEAEEVEESGDGEVTLEVVDVGGGEQICRRKLRAVSMGA